MRERGRDMAHKVHMQGMAGSSLCQTEMDKKFVQKVVLVVQCVALVLVASWVTLEIARRKRIRERLRWK
jgi:hypothetical protein